MNVTDSQKSEILARLKSGETITPMDALRDFGCFRLAARIKELRDEGYRIETKRGEDGLGKRWAVYYLAVVKVFPVAADGQQVLL